MILFVDLIFEEHLVEIQTKGDGTHHGRMSFMASLFMNYEPRNGRIGALCVL